MSISSEMDSRIGTYINPSIKLEVTYSDLKHSLTYPVRKDRFGRNWSFFSCYSHLFSGLSLGLKTVQNRSLRKTGFKMIRIYWSSFSKLILLIRTSYGLFCFYCGLFYQNLLTYFQAILWIYQFLKNNWIKFQMGRLPSVKYSLFL